MGRFILFFYLITFTFSHWAWGNCADLREDLREMRMAQTQITHNLLENYKTASEQVSYTAIKMNNDSTKQRLYVREQALRSAKAHTQRIEKTATLILRMDKATDELIKKVASCLKQK